MLEISDIDSWKNFFDLIFDSTTIIELKLDQNKCRITVLNNSHIAFYDAAYSKEFFDVYDVDDVESILIFVEDFYKILKSATKNDILTLESDDSYLKIILEHDGNRRLFELPLGHDYNSVPSLPSMEYDATFEVLLEDLNSPCNDLDKIVKTNKFTMETESDKLKIVSPSDSMTQYQQILDIDEVVSARTIVDLTYMRQLLKLKKINKMVEFKIGDNIPLSWNIVSPMEDIKITGLIAPIIEDEE